MPKPGDTKSRQCVTCEGAILSRYEGADHTGHPQTWSDEGWVEEFHGHYSCLKTLVKRIAALEAKLK